MVSNPGGYYSTFGYLSEGRRIGSQFFHPTSTRANGRTLDLERLYVCVALMQIKSLQEDLAKHIITERRTNGP